MFALPAAWLAQSDQKRSDTWTSWTLSCWRQICIGTLLKGGHPETKSTERSDSSSVQCNLLQPLRLSGQNPCFDFICILTRTVYLVHLGHKVIAAGEGSTGMSQLLWNLPVLCTVHWPRRIYSYLIHMPLTASIPNWIGDASIFAVWTEGLVVKKCEKMWKGHAKRHSSIARALCSVLASAIFLC